MLFHPYGFSSVGSPPFLGDDRPKIANEICSIFKKGPDLVLELRDRERLREALERPALERFFHLAFSRVS